MARESKKPTLEKLNTLGIFSREKSIAKTSPPNSKKGKVCEIKHISAGTDSGNHSLVIHLQEDVQQESPGLIDVVLDGFNIRREEDQHLKALDIQVGDMNSMGEVPIASKDAADLEAFLLYLEKRGYADKETRDQGLAFLNQYKSTAATP